MFQQCLLDINYYDFTRTDICDYAYPADNEYFGEFNQGCLNYESFKRPERLIEDEPEDPEEPTETEPEEDDVSDPIEEDEEEDEGEQCISDNSVYDVNGNTCQPYDDNQDYESCEN